MKRTAAILLILAIALSLCACGSSSSASQTGKSFVHPLAVNALTDDDGTAYFPTMDGGLLSIEGELQGGYITPDRKHVVYISQTGQIAWYNSDLAEEHVVTTQGVKVANVLDKGFFYIDSNDNIRRYTFADENDVLCCDTNAARVFSDVNLHIMYTKDNGIYILDADSEDCEKISSYDSSIRLCYINNDASFAVFAERDGDSLTVYSYENGEKEKVGEMKVGYDRLTVDTNFAESYYVIYNLGVDSLFIKTPGDDAIKVKLGDSLQQYSFYTPKDHIIASSDKEFNGLYILVDDGNDSGIIYWISKDGDREKVLSDVNIFHLNNGSIVYLTNDNELYSAKVKGADLSDEHKIASDVSSLDNQTNGAYIYYLKNFDHNTGTLYMYKIGDKEPVKVSSNVYAEVKYDTTSTGYLYKSIDGNTVYFFKNVEDGYGDFYKFKAGDKEITKIASEILVRSLTSGVFGGGLNKDFMIKKYISKEDGITYVNWIYYNGKETSVLVKDIHANSSNEIDKSKIAPASNT